MTEDPLSNMSPLLARVFISKAEMNTFPDSRCDDIISCIRKSVIDLRLRYARSSVRRIHCEGHMICAKEQGEATGRGSCHIVCARRVIRIVGGIDQWLPCWITHSIRIRVVITLPNRVKWSPEVVSDFCIPCGNRSIGHCEVNQRRQSRIFGNTEVL